MEKEVGGSDLLSEMVRREVESFDMLHQVRMRVIRAGARVGMGLSITSGLCATAGRLLAHSLWPWLTTFATTMLCWVVAATSMHYTDAALAVSHGEPKEKGGIRAMFKSPASMMGVFPFLCLCDGAVKFYLWYHPM